MQTDINHPLIRISTEQDIQHYWSDICSNGATHNQAVSWIAGEKIRTQCTENMQYIYIYITRQQLTVVIRKLCKQKAPSKDQYTITGYKSLLTIIVNCYNT